MAKFEIEIPDDMPWLAKYVPVKFDVPTPKDHCITQDGNVFTGITVGENPRLIVVPRPPAVRLKKKFPRYCLGLWCAMDNTKRWFLYTDNPAPSQKKFYSAMHGRYESVDLLAELLADFPSNSDLECDDWTHSKFQIGEEHVQ